MNNQVAYSEIKIVGTMFFTEKTWVIGLSEILNVKQSLIIEWDNHNIFPNEIREKLKLYTSSKISMLNNLQDKLKTFSY